MHSGPYQRFKGFTLVEVMVTAAVLSLGMVMIFQAFFSSLYGLRYLLNRLDVSVEMTNRIWEAQDSMRRTGSMQSAGGIIKGRGSDSYTWVIDPLPLDNAYGFYAASIMFSWKEHNRQVTLSRGFFINR